MLFAYASRDTLLPSQNFVFLDPTQWNGGSIHDAVGVRLVCPGVRAQSVLDSGAGRDVMSISY